MMFKDNKYESGAILDSVTSSDGDITLSWLNNGLFVLTVNKMNRSTFMAFTGLGGFVNVSCWHRLAPVENFGLSIDALGVENKVAYAEFVLTELSKHTSIGYGHLNNAVRLSEQTWGDT